MGPTSSFARFRPILTTVLLIIVLLAMWIAIEVYFALTAAPNPVIDYGEQLEQLVNESQDGREGEDAWSALMEAVELIPTAESLAYDTDAVYHEREILIQYDVLSHYENYRSEIEEHSFSIEEELGDLKLQRDLSYEALSRFDEVGITSRLDEVAASGVGVMPLPDSRDSMLIDLLIPNLGPQRNLARALRAKMTLAAEEGDWQTYTDSFEHIMAIGRLTGEQSFLIQRLVGIAIRSLGAGALRDDLVAGRVAQQALPGLAEAFDRQSQVAPMEFALRSEMIWTLDAIQWLHSKRGRLILSDSRRLEWGSGSSPKIINVASIAFPRKAESEEWFRGFFEACIESSRLTPAERRQQPIDSKWFVFNWNMRLQEMLTPAISRAISADDKWRINEAGLRTILAIELFRSDTGSLPDSLDSLVPEYLDEVPIDVYAEGGLPLRYIVLEQPSEQGQDYLLYTVAIDGVDNDGAVAEEPYDALVSGDKNADYVFNHVSDD
ncbi:MAG: hypothetical protein Phyf2KO_12110 [Phycisphaerales bacterium]